MATRTERTDLLITAKTQGFQQAKTQADQILKSITQGMEAQAKGFEAAHQAAIKYTRSMIPGGFPYPTALGAVSGAGAGFRPPGYPMGPAGVPGGPGGPGGGGLGGPGGKDPRGPGGGESVQIDFDPLLKKLDELKEAIEAGDARKAERDKERQEKEEQAAADQRKRSFTHGFLQTALPTAASAFLDNEPGMARQVMGQLAGSMVAKVATGAKEMFTGGGLGGLATALTAIPIFGTPAAGLLQSAAQYGMGAIEFHKQYLELAPYGGAIGMGAGRRRAQKGLAAAEGKVIPNEAVYGKATDAARAQAVNKALEPYGETVQGIVDRVQSTSKGFSAKQRTQIVQQTLTGLNAIGDRYVREHPEEIAAMIQDELPKVKQQRGQQLLNVDAARARVERAISPRGLMRSSGMRYAGMSEQEAQPFVKGLLQSGGGTFGGLLDTDMLRASFAAKRLYDLDEGTSGAFLQAGRRGGLAGGGGGEAMARTVGDAMKLGLEGSEVNKYMQIVAEGISKWETTGIPFSRESLAGMGREFTRLGFEGPRGMQMARGMQDYAKGMGQRGGPQDVFDLAAMQAMGWTGKGGAREYIDVMGKMEQGGLKGPQLRAYMQRLMQMGGGGDAGQILMMAGLQRKGIQMSMSEGTLAAAELEGRLSPGQAGVLEGIGTRRRRVAKEGGVVEGGAPKNLEDMLSQATTMMKQYGGVVQAQASLQNQQLAIGERLMEPVMGFQRSTMKLSEGITTLVEGPLKTLSVLVGDVAGGFQELARDMARWMGGTN